jgi:regulation of enolase protein 1 (concanavalin A-like superfamily)
MIEDFSEWQWINEPAKWSAGEDLRITADARTDLWRVTHYGYTYDTAHIFGRTLPGDLRVTTTFQAPYAAQYDQAGAMVRIDEKNWIKTGVEFFEGRINLSAVVTRDFSDWSVLPVAGPVESVTLELTREGDTVIVKYGLDGAEPETLLRLAYLPPKAPALAGVMCAAPTGEGFETRFTSLTVS